MTLHEKTCAYCESQNDYFQRDLFVKPEIQKKVRAFLEPYVNKEAVEAIL